MKKRILVFALIAICVAIAAGGTSAYFNTEGTARNVITSGKVDVTLIEQQNINGELQPFPNGAIAANPGDTVSKIVSVKCEDEAAWVRVSYDTCFYDGEGNQMNLSEDEILTLVSVDTDEEHWAYKDGWWYYKAPLNKDEITHNLFENVKFSGNMNNEFQGSTAKVNVTVQAVQVANNGTEFWEVAGW